MKRIFLVAAALFSAAVGYAQEQVQEKKALTLEQVAQGMPEGIVNSIPMPVGWYDKGNLIVSQDRELGLYNLRTGETSPYQMPEP